MPSQQATAPSCCALGCVLSGQGCLTQACMVRISISLANKQCCHSWQVVSCTGQQHEGAHAHSAWGVLSCLHIQSASAPRKQCSAAADRCEQSGGGLTQGAMSALHRLHGAGHHRPHQASRAVQCVEACARPLSCLLQGTGPAASTPSHFRQALFSGLTQGAVSALHCLRNAGHHNLHHASGAVQLMQA